MKELYITKKIALPFFLKNVEKSLISVEDLRQSVESKMAPQK